jgi:drug/metabolite transporter (DMT)-like permease
MRTSSIDQPLWVGAALAVSTVAIVVFLLDRSVAIWSAVGLAGISMAGVILAVVASRDHIMVRGVILLAALVAAALLVVYDLLDAVMDMLVEADWPVAIVSAVLVLMLGTVMTVLVSDEE